MPRCRDPGRLGRRSVAAVRAFVRRGACGAVRSLSGHARGDGANRPGRHRTFAVESAPLGHVARAGDNGYRRRGAVVGRRAARTAPAPSAPQVAAADANRRESPRRKKEVEGNAKKPSLPVAASSRAVMTPPAETPPPQTRDARASSDRVASAKTIDALRRLAQTKDADRLEPSSNSSELTKTEARARQDSGGGGGSSRREAEGCGVTKRAGRSASDDGDNGAAATAASSSAGTLPRPTRRSRLGRRSRPHQPMHSRRISRRGRSAVPVAGRGGGTLNRAALNGRSTWLRSSVHAPSSVRWRVTSGWHHPA